MQLDFFLVEGFMKERFEWIHSWCDYSEKNDLPRVLLVGDSITNAYQEIVRELLRGVCYVDYLATSYSVDNIMFSQLCLAFFDNSRYDIIHFNHGLHGYDMTKETYKIGIEELLCNRRESIILATSTVVYKNGVPEIHDGWREKLAERNGAMEELAEKYGYSIDDLFAVSKTIDYTQRSQDGYHYAKEGSAVLAASVVESIKNVLNSIK